MTNEEHVSRLPRDYALHGRHISGQRGQWVLHGCDVVTLALQSRDHIGPTGAVRERTVDENDIVYSHRGAPEWDNRFDSGTRQPYQLMALATSRVSVNCSKLMTLPCSSRQTCVTRARIDFPVCL